MCCRCSRCLSIWVADVGVLVDIIIVVVGVSYVVVVICDVGVGTYCVDGTDGVV